MRPCPMRHPGDLRSTRPRRDRPRPVLRATPRRSDLIGCTRAGVWIFLDTAEGRALRCMAMYDRRVDRVVSAADMLNAAAALLRHWWPMAAWLLPMRGITPPRRCSAMTTWCRWTFTRCSMSVFGQRRAFAPSAANSRAPLVWSQRQIQMLRQIGSRASLALLNAANAHTGTQPAALWEPSSPNRLLTMPARSIRTRTMPTAARRDAPARPACASPRPALQQRL